MWNFKGTLWNSTQNILPIHWKIRFLYNIGILRALRFKSSYAFLKCPPTESDQYVHFNNGYSPTANLNLVYLRGQYFGHFFLSTYLLPLCYILVILVTKFNCHADDTQLYISSYFDYYTCVSDTETVCLFFNLGWSQIYRKWTVVFLVSRNVETSHSVSSKYKPCESTLCD